MPRPLSSPAPRASESPMTSGERIPRGGADDVDRGAIVTGSPRSPRKKEMKPAANATIAIAAAVTGRTQ